VTREQWKDWLEGTGYVAIVASLIFVGIETRNSTKQAALTTQALEISAYQELMDNISEMNALVIQDPEVAEFLYKSYRTTEELTNLEEFRLSRNMYLRFRHGDIAFFQFERGAIDEARLRSALEVLNLGNPRVREFWDQNQLKFVASYRNYINGLIDESMTNEASD
jgi:hypothetical protein